MPRFISRVILPTLLPPLLVASMLLVGAGILGRGPAGAVGARIASDHAAVNIGAGTDPDNRPALALSPQDDTICATWATFGAMPDAYVRLYTVTTGGWSPALTAPALNLSESPGENTQAVRCAIDTAGNTHVVWQEGGSKRLEYRRLPTGADPASLANWTAKATIPTPEDAQWADLAASFSEGRVWLAYYALAGGHYNLFVQSWTPAGGWSAAQQLTTGGGQYPRIAVDRAGYVQLVYRSGGALSSLYRDSHTGAWTPAGQLPGSGGAYEQTGLAVDRITGDVHAVYSGDAGSGRIIYYVRKTGPTGGAFSRPVALTGAGNYVVPRVAWSSSGRLMMVSDLREGSGALVANTSADNGASWVGPVPFAEGTRAQWPWVVANGAGSVYAAYWNTNDHNIYFTALGVGDTPPGPPTPTRSPIAAPRSPTPGYPPGATATPPLGAVPTGTAAGSPRPALTPTYPAGTRAPTATTRPGPTSTPSPTPTRTPPAPPTAPPVTSTATPRPAGTAIATPAAGPTITSGPVPTSTLPPTVTPAPTVRATSSPAGTAVSSPTPALLSTPSPTRRVRTARPPMSPATQPTPRAGTAITPSPGGEEATVTSTLSVTTAAGVPVSIDAAGLGHGRQVTFVTQGTSGAVTSAPDGTLIYTPHPGFVGVDRFTCTLTDHQGVPTTVAVTITVTPIPSGLPNTGAGGAARGASMAPSLVGIAACAILLAGRSGWSRRSVRRPVPTRRVARCRAGR